MAGGNAHVRDLIKKDQWSVESGEKQIGPYVIRYRTPVLNSEKTHGYERLLRIVWIYADENTGALPSSIDSEQMNEFEGYLLDSLEKDYLSVLTAVLTFDGARQWVFYTYDISKCSERINSISQKSKPYPIELDTQSDKGWEYLNERILQGRS